MMRGCPFGTIGNEITEHDELTRRDLELLFEVVRNKLVAFFLSEKVRGRIRPSANEVALGDYCIASVQGAMLLGKIRRDRATVDRAIDQAMAHLSTWRLLPRSAGRSPARRGRPGSPGGTGAA